MSDEQHSEAVLDDSNETAHHNSYDQEQLQRIIEGAILAAGEALSVDKLHSLFEEHEAPEKSDIREILQRIAENCDGRGFQLVEVASGWRFQVREDVATWVNRLWDEKPQKYSRAMLETLALIAYRQPITRGDIEDVRGVAVSSHIIKTLVERDWVKVVGHRDVPGRPSLYATTRQFLDYFNLKSLDELPTLSELKDIDGLNGSLDLDDENSTGADTDVPDTDAADEAAEAAVQPMSEDLMDQSVVDDSASGLAGTVDEDADEDSDGATEEDMMDGEDIDDSVVDDSGLEDSIAADSLANTDERVNVRSVDIPAQFDQDKALPDTFSTGGEPYMDAELTIEQVEFAEARRKREMESTADEPSDEADEDRAQDDEPDYSAGSLFSKPAPSKGGAEDSSEQSGENGSSEDK